MINLMKQIWVYKKLLVYMDKVNKVEVELNVI